MLRYLIIALLLLIGSVLSTAQTLQPVQNRKGLYGYANAKGKTVIPHRYDYAEPFSDSIAVVMRNGKFFMLMPDGKLFSDTAYELIWPYHQGYALVRKNGKYGYLDRQGKVVRDFWFDRALLFIDNYAEAWQGNVTFLLYRDGNVFPYGNNRLQRLSHPLSTLPQEMPRFPGGVGKRNDIVSELIVKRFGNLPSGMVSVRVIVERDGSLSDITLMNALGENLSAQVLWALENMPPWIPARQNGEAVRAQVSFSLRFLPDNDAKLNTN